MASILDTAELAALLHPLPTSSGPDACAVALRPAVTELGAVSVRIGTSAHEARVLDLGLAFASLELPGATRQMLHRSARLAVDDGAGVLALRGRVQWVHHDGAGDSIGVELGWLSSETRARLAALVMESRSDERGPRRRTGRA